MKCVSCEVEINPKWRHAIDINICPFCGKGIMEEHLKNLLTSLHQTMEQLTAYPDQVNDWMLSNFNFIKTDAPNLVEYISKEDTNKLFISLKKDNEISQDTKKYTVKVKTELGEEDIETEKIQSDEKTNDFFKRAEVKLTVDKNQNNSPNKDKFSSVSEKTEHLKNIKKQIEKAGSVGITNEAGLAVMIDPDMLDKADPDTIAEYQSLMSGESISSSINNHSDDADDGDGIPSVVLAMANQSKGKGVNNAADLIKMQQMRDRVSQSRANFESGENRGGKGGGFSRSS